MFKLLKRKWLVLKELAFILSIPYKATVSFQRQSLTLSDVFGIWIDMQLHLTACSKRMNYQTNLAKHLLCTLSERKEVIFKNPFMSGALFLDPRFRNQIVRDDRKMEQAKETLKNVWRRFVALSVSDTNTTQASDEINNVSTGSSNISFDYDTEGELDKYLNGVSPEKSKSCEVDIELLLDSYDPAPIKAKENILEYWESRKDEDEHLYKLAMVVLAIPPTEVQIERDFSNLNFVFSDRRCQLTEERLEDIMGIHLNDELFHEVKEEELIEIQKNDVLPRVLTL